MYVWVSVFLPDTLVPPICMMSISRKQSLTLIFLMTALVACHPHSGNTVLRPAEVRTFGEFKQLFPVIGLPYVLAEDTLKQVEPDSSAIPRQVINLFLPDSLTRGIFTKKARKTDLEWFALGQTQDKRFTYLWLKVTGSGTRAGYLCLFDKMGKYRGGLLVGKTIQPGDHTRITTVLDRHFNITVSREQQVYSGNTILKQEVYAANPNGHFSLILVNSNQPVNPVQLYNPIVALPQKHRYSGDYTAGKMNLVSIRDDSKKGYFRFFIHFSRQKGNCTGEVDGQAEWKGAHVAEFHENSGPCAIRFLFRGTRVSLQEIGNCGAYRGMNCLFNGNFLKRSAHAPRKKYPHHKRA